MERNRPFLSLFVHLGGYFFTLFRHEPEFQFVLLSTLHRASVLQLTVLNRLETQSILLLVFHPHDREARAQMMKLQMHGMAVLNHVSLGLQRVRIDHTVFIFKPIQHHRLERLSDLGDGTIPILQIVCGELCVSRVPRPTHFELRFCPFIDPLPIFQGKYRVLGHGLFISGFGCTRIQSKLCRYVNHVEIRKLLFIFYRPCHVTPALRPCRCKLHRHTRLFFTSAKGISILVATNRQQ
ncbi:hypothetical protein M105_2226 [Bacteroides fragilis str. 1009-4-F |nr:hypothetical protein M106_2712 [Bacteroides fragilis str. 1009-4-F \